MIKPDEFRFVFIQGGVTFGLTQDEDLVRRAAEYGLPNRPYEREAGVNEWEVNLGSNFVTVEQFERRTHV